MIGKIKEAIDTNKFDGYVEDVTPIACPDWSL